MFGYQYLILANQCHTALWTIKLTVAQQVIVLFYRHKCCFNKQLSNKHIFTTLSYFPIYRSRWSFQDIRHCVMFGYQYLILANHCHAALWTVRLTVAQQVIVLFYRHKCCFNKQLSNKHIFTTLSYFPLYQRILCQHIQNISACILSFEVLKPP